MDKGGGLDSRITKRAWTGAEKINAAEKRQCVAELQSCCGQYAYLLRRLAYPQTR